jgi:hypothetical protein
MAAASADSAAARSTTKAQVDEFQAASEELVRLRMAGASDDELRAGANRVTIAAINLVQARSSKAVDDTIRHQRNLRDVSELLDSRPSSPSGLSELFERDVQRDSDKDFLPLTPPDTPRSRKTKGRSKRNKRSRKNKN